MREEDILLWPDGSWCFRFEIRLRDGLIRNSQYRAVSYQSDEWDRVVHTRAYAKVPSEPKVSRVEHA